MAALNEKSMSIVKKIESLILWYVIAAISALIFTWGLVLLTSDIIEATTEVGRSLYWIGTVQVPLKYLTNAVVGAWLYINTTGSMGKKIIWGLFGVVGNLLAALIYIVVFAIEAGAFNKRL
jgi:hypothetical protein